MGWEPSVWAGPPVWAKGFQPERAEGSLIWAEEPPSWVWAFRLGGGPSRLSWGFLPGHVLPFLWAEGPPIWNVFLLSGLLLTVWAEASCLGCASFLRWLPPRLVSGLPV